MLGWQSSAALVAVLIYTTYSTEDCNLYSGCSDCAVRIGCSWCVSSLTCMADDDINGTISMCENDELIEESPGCVDSEFVTLITFDDYESLVYEMKIEDCQTEWEYDVDKDSYYTDYTLIDYFKEIDFLGDISDNENDLNLEIACETQYATIEFWTLDSDDINMNYHLFGRLISHYNADSKKGKSIKSAMTDEWPPCEIYVYYGVVTEITCVNGSTINNGTNGTNMTDEYSTMSQQTQSDMLLHAMHYLLPRTDIQLYSMNEEACFENSESMINENEPNGEAHSCRVFQNDSDTNYGLIKKIYDIDSFDSWDYESKPDVLTMREYVKVDDNDLHVIEANFNERIILNFRSLTNVNLSNNSNSSYDSHSGSSYGLVGYQIYDVRVNMELLSQTPNIEIEKFAELENMIYENENDYFTVFLTSRDWRRSEYYENENEASQEWIVDGTDGSNNDNNNDDSDGDFRRRLGSEFISFLGGTRIYDTAASDSPLTEFDFLGKHFEVHFYLDAGFNLLWEDDPDADDPPNDQGCSWFGGLGARLQSSNVQSAIDDCCDTQKLSYADCDATKSDADKAFKECIEDGGAGSITKGFFASDLNTLGFVKYYISKFKYCDIDWSGIQLYVNVGCYLTMDNDNILDFSIGGYYGVDQPVIEEKNENIIYRGCWIIIFGLKVCFEVGYYYGFNIQVSGAYLLTGPLSDNPYGMLTVTPSFSGGFYADASLSVWVAEAGLTLNVIAAQLSMPVSAILYNLGAALPLAFAIKVDFEIILGRFQLLAWYRYINGFRCYWKGWSLRCGWRWSSKKIVWSKTLWTAGQWYIDKWLYKQWGNIGTDFDYKVAVWIQGRIKWLNGVLDDIEDIFGLSDLDAAKLLGLDKDEYRRSKTYTIVQEKKRYRIDLNDLPSFTIFELNRRVLLTGLNDTNDTFANATLGDDYVSEISFSFEMEVVVDTTDNVDFITYEVNNDDQMNYLKNQFFNALLENGIENQTDGYYFDIWQLSQLSTTRQEYEYPTQAPTNAPTFSPSNAPSNAPTNAPTYCDQHIHHWLLNNYFIDDQSIVKIYSPCDDIVIDGYSSVFDHSNYIVKFSFNKIEELVASTNYNNEIMYQSGSHKFSLLKTNVDILSWTPNYAYIDTNEHNYFSPILEVIGVGYIDYKDWNVENNVPIEIKFTLFYEKYESEYENGIAIDIDLQNWPFGSGSETRVLSIHIDVDIGAFPDIPKYEKINKPELSMLRSENYDYILMENEYYLLLSKTCTIDDSTQVSVTVDYDIQKNNEISLDLRFPKFEQSMQYSSQSGIAHSAS